MHGARALLARLLADRGRRRALLHGALVGAWIGSVLVAARSAAYYVVGGGVGMDCHAYWLAGARAHPYQAAPEQMDAFLYSPVFAQAMHPLSLLPWPVFLGLWMGAELACFVWLTRGLALRWRIPVLLMTVPELLIGNVYGFLALAVVLGLRRPGLWSFGFLTKLTTGLPGAVWFLARGSWGALLRLALVLVVVVGISFALSPGLWAEWVRFLLQHRDESGTGFGVRLLASLALTVYAARRGWPWLLPVAVLVAVPTWSGENKDLALLVAVVPLALDAHRQAGQDTRVRAGQDAVAG